MAAEKNFALRHDRLARALYAANPTTGRGYMFKSYEYIEKLFATEGPGS